MESVKFIIRAFLPGIFVEAQFWKERALRAEAELKAAQSQLSEIVSQYGTTICHEREQHAAERIELLNLLVTGNTTQTPPPLPGEQPGGDDLQSLSQAYNPNPVQRIYEQIRSGLAATAVPSPMTDDDVLAGVDEYLKQRAVM